MTCLILQMCNRYEGEETEVLRKLTEKDAEWCWLTAHEEAMARIQRMISTGPLRRHKARNHTV